MQAVLQLTEPDLNTLRDAVARRLSPRRMAHTLGVETAITQLGRYYLPNDIARLRVAALLHDVTKEWQGEEQLAYCDCNGIPLSEEERAVPKILHAKTGAAVAEAEFSAYVDAGILQAIRAHTTGDVGMSVFDELLYLADYIEPNRTYDDCVGLRDAFYGGYAAAGDKRLYLHKTVKHALEITVADLNRRGAAVFYQTKAALSWLSEIISGAAGK